ncbi:MAG: hypothetical protein JWN76_763 [Chitinophagaceae bacterium]|nr:hypothetical protein [Chitinophagaceae bacterium]
MKKLQQLLTLLLALSLVSFSSYAQDNSYGDDEIRGWIRTPQNIVSEYDANVIADRVMDAVGLSANFVIKAARVDNAAAMVFRGKRYIMYNPSFMNQINRATGNEWAAISVLAHEIGHQVFDHSLDGQGSNPKKELEADAFSGFALRRMGASLEEAQVAMKLVANYREDPSHPQGADRLQAIESGWVLADEQVRNNSPLASARNQIREQGLMAYNNKRNMQNNSNAFESRSFGNNRTLTTNTTSQDVLDERYILGDVYFKNDRSGQYFLTTKYDVVQVKNNRVVVLGKLGEQRNSNYPYVIYDDSNERMLVDTDGNILSEDGRQLGRLNRHSRG